MRWIPETERNKHLLQTAYHYLEGIHEHDLKNMSSGFSPPVAPPPKAHHKTKSGIKPSATMAGAIQALYRFPQSIIRWIADRMRNAFGMIQHSRKTRRVLAGILLIGLVVGGILGYALNESQQDDGDFYDNSYAPAETARYNNGTCLQEREYQTTVLVGGRKVDAYGTACLQPDGSWKRNLPTVPAY